MIEFEKFEEVTLLGNLFGVLVDRAGLEHGALHQEGTVAPGTRLGVALLHDDDVGLRLVADHERGGVVLAQVHFAADLEGIHVLGEHGPALHGDFVESVPVELAQVDSLLGEGLGDSLEVDELGVVRYAGNRLLGALEDPAVAALAGDRELTQADVGVLLHGLTEVEDGRSGRSGLGGIDFLRHDVILSAFNRLQR